MTINTKVILKTQSQTGAAAVGKVPTTSMLESGELAINTVDGKLFLKRTPVIGSPDIVEVGQNPYPTHANDNKIDIDTGTTYKGMFLTTDGSSVHWGTPSTVSAAAIDIAQDAHGFSVGAILYHNGTEYDLAQADDVATADVIGIVVRVLNANSFTMVTNGFVDFDAIWGTTGPWVPGKTYYLSATAQGVLTNIEPTAKGQISKPLLLAITSTRGFFYNWRGILNDIPESNIDTLLPMQSTNTIGKVLTSGANGKSYWDIGGGSGASSAINVAQTAHGFSKGQLLRFDGSAGVQHYVLANANNATNADVICIVSSVIDANNFTLTTQGFISGLSGLTPGASYFLSNTIPGGYALTEPTTAGHVSKPVLMAISSTQALFTNMRGIGVSILSVAPEVAVQTNNSEKYLTTNGSNTSWASPVTTFNTRSGAVTLTSADVVNALGFTPYNGSTNANGYITSSSVVTSFNARTGPITLTLTDIVNAGAASAASPTLTGTPLAPTASLGTNTTQIATTAFVQTNAQSIVNSAISVLAPIASPLFTGNPRAPTPAAGDNDTTIATTAFVQTTVDTAIAVEAAMTAYQSAIAVTGSTSTATSSTYTITVPNDGRVYVLNANCFAQGTYSSGTSADTGIQAQVLLDGNLIAANADKDATSTTSLFKATATAMRQLSVGTHTVVFKGVATGTSMTSAITLTCDYFVNHY